jgi:PHS family inorganic phosphate transporter-like MFS transporter
LNTSTAPGYWVTVALIEKLARRPIQILGFTIITLCLIVLSVLWTTISNLQTPFLIIFTIAQFFFQFGPNTTTFVYPGEVFPTRWRSTGHGIAAASGKLGAILGIQVVAPYFHANAQGVLAAFAVIMATGAAVSFCLLPETKGKTLEEMSQEDTVFVYTGDNGERGSRNVDEDDQDNRVVNSDMLEGVNEVDSVVDV